MSIRKHRNMKVLSRQLPVLGSSLTDTSIDPDPSLGLLTIPDVATLLKISVSSVRRLQQCREIPFRKIGGSIRFARGDIAAYLEKRRVDPIDQ